MQYTKMYSSDCLSHTCLIFIMVFTFFRKIKDVIFLMLCSRVVNIFFQHSLYGRLN